MKVTKLVHACLLVEMPAPVNRTALFDPGVMSESAVDVNSLEFLDDIFISHAHPDHMSLPLIKKLVAKFPKVKITGPREVVAKLKQEGLEGSSEPSLGVQFFDSPHEGVAPLFDPPEEVGIHYLNLLTHPGDSHSFTETMPVLALPVTAPWGSSATAINLALKLKPKIVLPIHDWHWRDEARDMMYDRFDDVLGKADIQFIKLSNGEPVVLDIEPEK